MSCRCDDNFTTNYAPSRSSPSHTVDVEDFTAVGAEVCYPHPSYWIKLCLVFNKLSFKNVIADFFWLSASIYSEWNCSCWWMSNSRWKKKKWNSGASTVLMLTGCQTSQHSAATSNDCIQTLAHSRKDHTDLMMVYMQHTAYGIIHNRMPAETAQTADAVCNLKPVIYASQAWSLYELILQFL